MHRKLREPTFASKYMYHTATVKGGFFIRPVLFCGEITKAQEKTLDTLGYSVFRLPPHVTLPHPVRCHPDMLMARLPSGKLLLTRNYFEANEKRLSPFIAHFDFCEDTLESCYPDDTKLNALAIKDTLFGGKTTATALREAYKHFVFVKQGYTHCAACKVGQGIITSDASLYRALVANDVDTLFIQAGHIALSPYDTGFIGGASLPLSESLTVFFGKLEDHPDYERMAAFAKKQGATLLSLSDEPLADFGGGYLLSE